MVKYYVQGSTELNYFVHLNETFHIPYMTDGTATTPAYCFYNNSMDSAANTKWGAMYNWYAVNTGKLAPSGWHVPNEAEWETLENWLIAHGYNWDESNSGNKIAKSMASQTDWSTNSTSGTPGNDLSINNRSGFTGLPSGGRDRNDYFGKNFYCNWWTATGDTSVVSGSGAKFRSISNNKDVLETGLIMKTRGFSVRLVRD